MPTDFSESDALAMASFCRDFARRLQRNAKVRSPAIMALDALAVLLDGDGRPLPTAAEIGALFELIVAALEQDD